MIARIASTHGVSLALHDLGGDGPPLLLCHPTGFHGMVWGPVASELADSYHVWAIDFRGHGDSTLPSSGSVEWDGFTDDVHAVAAHLEGAGPLVGAGHSMGGAALLSTEATHPGTFEGLWLFEPIVFPRIPPEYVRNNPLAHSARRRRAVFESRSAALAHYAAKPPLGGLAPEALEAYVHHGFRDLPDGTVILKCLPEIEAQVFEGSNNGVFDRLDRVKCPVTVAASGDGEYPALGAPRVAETLPDGRLERHEDLTHFGPMEQPRAVAQAIRAALSYPAG